MTLGAHTMMFNGHGTWSDPKADGHRPGMGLAPDIDSRHAESFKNNFFIQKPKGQLSAGLSRLARDIQPR